MCLDQDLINVRNSPYMICQNPSENSPGGATFRELHSGNPSLLGHTRFGRLLLKIIPASEGLANFPCSPITHPKGGGARDMSYNHSVPLDPVRERVGDYTRQRRGPCCPPSRSLVSLTLTEAHISHPRPQTLNRKA